MLFLSGGSWRGGEAGAGDRHCQAPDSKNFLKGEGGRLGVVACKARLGADSQDNPALLDVKQKWDKDGLDIVHLLDKTARDPSLGLAFNYASLLLNNSFFLEGMVSASRLLEHDEKGELIRQTGDDSTFPSNLGGEAKEAMLREKLEAYAEGIVGGGWLWVRTVSICRSIGQSPARPSK